MSAPRTTLGRLGRAALWAVTLAVLAFLVAPILAIVPLSFSAGSFLHYPLPGLSLQWYREFFGSPFWIDSVVNSLIIGAGATALATTLGTLAAFGLWLARLPARGVVLAVLIAPMVVPSVVAAVGLLFAYAPVGLANSHAGMILAHTALAAPFVVVTVSATLSGFDRTLLRAAAASGAGPATAFRRVVLPLIAPGVAAGALFAFAISLDEVVVALFLAGPGQRTLPRQMFAGLNDNLSLAIAAAATILIALSILLMATVGWLRGRAARLAARTGQP
ncbi:ABC transporter permease [Elioraea sp.]|uniref:ABC transporter permease n=1 Tax=Elioraea sp. TaxID=2185103 RepID=UPI0021DE7779|nr:ABC transporter permease [Elioraea sp.]GIX10240.1 MAG: ABC transporter permease [Elioraea sp.]